ncbi:mll6839 [Mesorhizobium japonicum MAFF 303099]|uniref:Mll6839 protein n=2 Tax=Mesorhizobium japonicum TaxID=2066070 RepID=Q987Z6_RHILO|nr:mll6839 [Mesorhizobium japonicum MAFF 303099]
MKRLLVGAAVLAASVVGADISAVSYISRSAGMAALAQESQSSPMTAGNSAAGYGNGGAALGAGGQAAGSPSSSSSVQTTGDGSSGSPDAAAKVGANPADAKAADDTSTTDGTKAADTKTTKAAGKAAKTTDAEAAPEEPAAQAMAAAAATTDSGDPEAIGTPKVDLPKAAGNGNLGYSIGIDVPAFHGIEPQIALNYNSSRKTKLGGLYQGWLGYAWGLDGFDVIERATPGYGMPAYDANDIYLLDGQAMVACVCRHGVALLRDRRHVCDGE